MLIDKKLFLKMRAGELTLDQVNARINKANFGVAYKVLDDLRDRLDPDLLRAEVNSEEHLKKLYNKKLDETVTVEEILEPREPWMGSARCRRSLLNNVKKKKTEY